ncbi:MAG: magnesium transporter [Streptococcaceae bacterium]|jgi:magnesium transporter|nr:magnesium transporter [Streptococcaceae bacterium]
MNEKEFEEKEQHFNQLMAYMESDSLKAFRELFLSLHAYEQGQFYLKLSKVMRKRLYSYMSPTELAEMFDLLEEENSDITDYLFEMSPEYAAAMIGDMYSDNAADLLHQVGNQEVVLDYLKRMDANNANAIKNLMHYRNDTAGAIMTREFISIIGNQTVRSAMYVLKNKAEMAETIYYVYVTNQDEELKGVITLKDLIINEDDALIFDIMNKRVISVDVNNDQEDVAQRFRDYDFLALPVVDAKGHLQGIVTVDDIIDVIDDEAVSDYSGLAGVDVEEVSKNPFCAASKRLPWLIGLVFLGLGTAFLINHYENIMEKKVAGLAVFLTLITGTSGNAGTQSLAVAVRRLTLKDEDKTFSWQMIFSELATGLITGLVVGCAIFLIVLSWKKDIWLGFAVGFSMFTAINVGNLAGSFIPMGMKKLGVDPAVASGPFISTLSDLTSVFIYFNIAHLFL